MWFVREHWMLLAAAFVAIASMIFVPPDEIYLTYFDWQTICCLFCVLAVANAFRRIGAFDRIARNAIEHVQNSRTLAFALMLVTALFSMAFTNDVALIIMLPLSATMLVKLNKVRLVPIIFALQALTANLCGMITPFGNPQNIYLYSCYQLGLTEFLSTMIIPFAISVFTIAIFTWALTGSETQKHEDVFTSSTGEKVIATSNDENASTNELTKNLASPEINKQTLPIDSRRTKLYIVLFVIAMLAIFRLIPFIAAVFIICISIFVSDRKALLEVDYALLATFVCFFIFSGNVSRIPELGIALELMMNDWGLLASSLTSQVISNVPAAVILSHFTEAWRPLLVGVNIGGAGTFVGSLASLIAIRYFGLSRKVFAPMREPGAPTMAQFLVKFGLLNMVVFLILLGICQVVFRYC